MNKCLPIKCRDLVMLGTVPILLLVLSSSYAAELRNTFLPLLMVKGTGREISCFHTKMATMAMPDSQHYPEKFELDVNRIILNCDYSATET